MKLFAIAHGLSQFLEMLLISRGIELPVTSHFLLRSFQTNMYSLILTKIASIKFILGHLSKYQGLKFFKIKTRNLCSQIHSSKIHTGYFRGMTSVKLKFQISRHSFLDDKALSKKLLRESFYIDRRT